MPRVPVYDSQQVDQRPVGTPYSNLQVTPEDEGAGIGKAIEGIGAQVTRIHQEETNKANVAAVQDAVAQLDSHNETLLNSAEDPTAPGSGGFLAQKGDRAVELSTGAIETAQQKALELENSLQNDEQKRAFRVQANGSLLAARRQIENHTRNQIDASQAQSWEGLQEAKLNAIATGAADAPTVAIHTQALEDAARVEGMRRGYSGDGLEGFVSAARQKAVRTATESLLDSGSITQAQSYFAVHRQDLGTAAPALEARLRSLSVEQQAGDAAAKAFGASINPQTQFPDEAKAIAEWDKLPEGPVKKATLEHLRTRLIVADQTHKKQNEDLYGQALALYQRTGTLSTPQMAQLQSKLSNEFNPGGPELWQKLVNIRDEKIRLGRSSDAEGRRAQAEVNRIALETYAGMSADDQAKVDPAKAFPNAERSVQLAISAKQKKVLELINGGGLPQYSEFKRDLTDLAAAQKIPKDLRAGLIEHMDTWWNSHDKAHPPTRDEVNKELAAQLLRGKTGWFGSKYRFQVKDGEEFTPLEPGDQPYRPNQGAAPAAAPQPVQRKRITRTDPKSGETRFWNGKAWVKE